jgi:hypothetical protein
MKANNTENDDELKKRSKQILELTAETSDRTMSSEIPEVKGISSEEKAPIIEKREQTSNILEQTTDSTEPLPSAIIGEPNTPEQPGTIRVPEVNPTDE